MLDVEKFVLDNLDSMAMELDPVNIISMLIRDALAQDREEREVRNQIGLLIWDKPMTSKQAAKYHMTKGFVAAESCKPDPLSAKLVRLAEEAKKEGRGLIVWKWRILWYVAMSDKVNAREPHITWNGPTLEAAADAALQEISLTERKTS